MFGVLYISMGLGVSGFCCVVWQLGCGHYSFGRFFYFKWRVIA